MIRGLVFCGIVLLASASQAATVKFSGTYGLLAGSDNLGIVGQQFLATLETDGGANILGGQIWFNPPTVNHTLKYVLSGGTVALGGGTTTFSGISGGGGTLSFQLNQQAAGFSQSDFLALSGAGGSSVWLTGIAGGTTNIYNATITAVPEPSTMAFLGSLVLGCSMLRRRRS